MFTIIGTDAFKELLDVIYRQARMRVTARLARFESGRLRDVDPMPRPG